MHANLPSYFDYLSDLITMPTTNMAKNPPQKTKNTPKPHNGAHNNLLYYVIQAKVLCSSRITTELQKVIIYFWKQGVKIRITKS